MMPLMGSLERILLGNPLGGSYADGVYTGMWVQGSINIDTGEETSSGTGVRSGYLDARENAYYTQRTIGWGTFDKISWYFYASEKEFLGVKTDTTWTALELAPVNCAYIRLVISNDATPISPEDVPGITLEDRSIWGWKDVDAYNAIYSTKTVTTQIDHYYYQNNQNKFLLRVNAGTQRLYISDDRMVKSPVSNEDSQLFLAANEGATPTNIGDLVFEDRDVWGWNWANAETQVISLPINIEKPLVTAEYSGDLQRARLAFYSSPSTWLRAVLLPVENAPADTATLVRCYIESRDNPNITPADMVNHGTWTVTFSDPVSEVWQSDGSVYYTPHNSEIQKGKILTITPPESFKAVSLVVQDSTGQNSHDITGGAEVSLSESTEWVYLTVGVSENPDVNLTNIDSYREQWSYSYKEIPVPVGPHWEGENFVFSASDIQMGKAWQKSGDDIILVDDAGSVALPMIPNPSAGWRILINNNLGVTMSGMQLRKTSAGVSVQESYIYSGSSLSIILGEEDAQVAFYGANSIGASAEDIYRGITITGSEG